MKFLADAVPLAAIGPSTLQLDGSFPCDGD
jgi:hypothetical protein